MMALIGIGIATNNQNHHHNITTPEPETAAFCLELKKKNEELQEELRRSKEREQHVTLLLRQAQDRLRVAEDAEERLCSQLGELEAEALHCAREYHARTVSLMEQISRAHALLNSTNAIYSSSSSSSPLSSS